MCSVIKLLVFELICDKAKQGRNTLELVQVALKGPRCVPGYIPGLP